MLSYKYSVNAVISSTLRILRVLLTNYLRKRHTVQYLFCNVCRGRGICSASKHLKLYTDTHTRRTLSWKGLINVNHSLHNNKYSLHDNKYSPMKFKWNSRNDYINKTWAIFLKQRTPSILFKNTVCTGNQIRSTDWIRSIASASY